MSLYFELRTEYINSRSFSCTEQEHKDGCKDPLCIKKWIQSEQITFATIHAKDWECYQCTEIVCLNDDHEKFPPPSEHNRMQIPESAIQEDGSLDLKDLSDRGYSAGKIYHAIMAFKFGHWDNLKDAEQHPDKMDLAESPTLCTTFDLHLQI